MNQLFSGLKSWYWQRISAVFLLVALPYLIFAIINLDLNSFAEWQNWTGQLLNQILIIVTSIALNFHAWVGFRDIILDYVPHNQLKLLILTASATGFVILTLWVVILII